MRRRRRSALREVARPLPQALAPSSNLPRKHPARRSLQLLHDETRYVHTTLCLSCTLVVNNRPVPITAHRTPDAVHPI